MRLHVKGCCNSAVQRDAGHALGTSSSDQAVSLAVEASAGRSARGKKGVMLMVARDGIEPPTPAFSGPRSTTELPGLSADKLQFLRGIRSGRLEVGSTNSLLQRLG